MVPASNGAGDRPASAGQQIVDPVGRTPFDERRDAHGSPAGRTERGVTHTGSRLVQMMGADVTDHRGLEVVSSVRAGHVNRTGSPTGTLLHRAARGVGMVGRHLN